MFPFSQVRSSAASTTTSVTLPQDVFATSLQTGTGASPRVVTGIDMLGRGGLVWSKLRNNANSHFLVDTVRGASKFLVSDTTAAEGSAAAITPAFFNDGFSATAYDSTSTAVNWSFARAAKFFDIITWTGDGTNNRVINHNLGITPGMMIVKRLNSGNNWTVYHRGLPDPFINMLLLNDTGATFGASPSFRYLNAWDNSSFTFGVSNSDTNASGGTYIAYIFAHDPSADGIVQCGSVTLDGSGTATVNLGWKPKFLLYKYTTTAGSWGMVDTSRGWSSGNENIVFANSSNSEVSAEAGAPTFTGFNIAGFSANTNLVYMAIREPYNPIPPITAASSPQEVFSCNALPATQQNGMSVDTAIDMVSRGGMFWGKVRNTTGSLHEIADTVRGVGIYSSPSSANIDATPSDVTSFLNTGVTLGLGSGNLQGGAGAPLALWSFARAKKFFDIVPYIGDGATTRNIAHGLGITPGMIVIRRQDTTVSNWLVTHRSMTTPFGSHVFWNATNPDSGTAGLFGGASDTTFTLKGLNEAGGAFLAYVFAHDSSADGFVQCGSYTTDGSASASVTLGWKPQYLMIKAISASSNWFVFDSSRTWDAASSVSAYLNVNVNNAESTGSFGGPNDTGFTITGLGAANTTFIYMAIRSPTSNATPNPYKPQDVYSASTYTGTGAAQFITTGVDLPGKGGMLWNKTRSGSGYQHSIVDTVRGISNVISSASTNSQNSVTDSITSLTSTGYNLGPDSTSQRTNFSGLTYGSWSFAEAPKFFDIVTWTGDDKGARKIPHGLGLVPGMIVARSVTSAHNTCVWHRNTPRQCLFLNSPDTTYGYIPDYFPETGHTSGSFTVGSTLNISGRTYIAYVFAHDTASDGLIKCGTFANNNSVTLGWKPQYIMMKRIDSGGAAVDWLVVDSVRGWGIGNDYILRPNTSAAENQLDQGVPTTTGFTTANATGTWIYMAVRAPILSLVASKPQDVFATSTYTGTNSTRSIVNGVNLYDKGGMLMFKSRSGGYPTGVIDTARGITQVLQANSTGAEVTASAGQDVTSVNMDGFSLGTGTNAPTNVNGDSVVAWAFARASKFFDVVTYTGDATSNRQIPHGLGVAPGMIIVKSRSSGSYDWFVYHQSLGINFDLRLNATTTAVGSGVWGTTGPNALNFNVGAAAGVNGSGQTYVAYIFAHDTATDGSIQCGSSTANSAGTFTIPHGWTDGSQYILYKNTTSATNWTIADVKRNSSGTWGGPDGLLNPNTTGGEFSGSDIISESNGVLTVAAGGANANFIWMVIRTPYQPPNPYKPKDVFATNTYTATGSTQTITSGVNLLNKGGMLWSKTRGSGTGVITDTIRGLDKILYPSGINSQAVSTTQSPTSVSTIGFTSPAFTAGDSRVTWSFARANRFLDIVTWTGDGSSSRVISHGLGTAPGMIIVKRLDSASTSGWPVYHRSLTSAQYLYLNNINSGQTSGASTIFPADPTNVNFTIGSFSDINASGGTYVAYLFAHDAASDGLIQCGSFTGAATVNLGWQPQFILIKATSVNDDWFMLDTARGLDTGNDKYLIANSSGAEGSGPFADLTSTGFVAGDRGTCVYMAIRGPDPVANPLKPKDVFATSLYTGNGGTQIISNGINLASRGGLVWTKQRSASQLYNHQLVDTVRGVNKSLATNQTSAESADAGSVTSFGSSSFTLGQFSDANQSGDSEVAWSFARAAKFFDIVTWTGDGTSIRQIPHSLGVLPGMIIVKSRTGTTAWPVYHRSTGDNSLIYLNTTATPAALGNNIPTTTATNFTLGGSANVNASGQTYVAYVFAHDSSSDGLIQCGAVTGPNATVNLGWKPQYLMLKRTDTADSWYIIDAARGYTVGNDQYLSANTTNAEVAFDWGAPTDTGFTLSAVSGTYVYMAIRAPDPVPPKPQEVFATTTYSGNSASKNIVNGLDLAGKGGLAWFKDRTTGNGVGGNYFLDTVRGPTVCLVSNTTAADAYSFSAVTSFNNNGFSMDNSGRTNDQATTYVNWSFARAPKFFDIVTYSGDGTNNRQIAHNLGVAPGMIIVKCRSTATNWIATHRSLPQPLYDYLLVNGNNANNNGDATVFGSGANSTFFVVGGGNSNNVSGQTYVAYLFAHDPSADGIVQCGSATTSNGTFTISHGWPEGVQWVLAKRTDAAEDWYIFDTQRSPSFSGADKFLNPNLSRAELSSDIVTQLSGSIRLDISGAQSSYIWAVIRAPY